MLFLSAYIRAIRSMEESVQMVIMASLQEVWWYFHVHLVTRGHLRVVWCLIPLESLSVIIVNSTLLMILGMATLL